MANGQGACTAYDQGALFFPLTSSGRLPYPCQRLKLSTNSLIVNDERLGQCKLGRPCLHTLRNPIMVELNVCL
jgi:hypothetical protein